MDPKEILEEQREFYQNLYKSDRTINFKLKNDLNIVIPADLKEIHEKPFMKDEITQAVKKLARNKTPGICSFTADFYKMFWNKIGDLFFDAITSMYEEQRVPDQMKKGILNLIPKPNKDARRLKHLRPITLLSSDYKIIEKAIALRLEKCLNHVIHMDQQGFVKGRQMSTNIRLLFDLMKYTEKNNIDVCIINLDFLKCFDKIEHTCINGAMKYFGLATYLQNWISILYKDFIAYVQNNGNFSKKVRIEKGVHQGRCASSLLFLFCAEILAIELRSAEQIEGIPIKEIINLLGQFADDLDVYQLFKQDSLRTVFEVIENFKKHSGFTISYEKTQIY